MYACDDRVDATALLAFVTCFRLGVVSPTDSEAYGRPLPAEVQHASACRSGMPRIASTHLPVPCA